MPRLESAFQADRQRETVAESSEAIAGDIESGLRGPLEIGRSERGCEASRPEQALTFTPLAVKRTVFLVRLRPVGVFSRNLDVELLQGVLLLYGKRNSKRQLIWAPARRKLDLGPTQLNPSFRVGPGFAPL